MPRKNQQGDVERVISADGTVLAAYTYDAWGNVLTSEAPSQPPTPSVAPGTTTLTPKQPLLPPEPLLRSRRWKIP